MIRKHIDLIAVAALACTIAIGWATRDFTQVVFDPTGARIGVFPGPALHAPKAANTACKLPHILLPHVTISVP